MSKIVGYVVSDDGTMRAVTEDSTETEPVEDEGQDYGDWQKARLEAEVERRNAERDDDEQIVVDGNGNKADLVAALVADDEE